MSTKPYNIETESLVDQADLELMTSIEADPFAFAAFKTWEAFLDGEGLEEEIRGAVISERLRTVRLCEKRDEHLNSARYYAEGNNHPSDQVFMSYYINTAAGIQSALDLRAADNPWTAESITFFHRKKFWISDAINKSFKSAAILLKKRIQLYESFDYFDEAFGLSRKNPDLAV